MNFETLPTILGERVTLRPFSDEDVSTVAVLANDRSVSEGTKITPFPYTGADAARWIDGHAAYIASGTGYPFAVVKRQSGELVGAVEIRRDEDDADAYEIGYWIGAPYRGGGFATEAVRLVLGFAANHLPLGRVGAYVDVENTSSRRVLAKCGMRLVKRGASRSGQDYFSAWLSVQIGGLLTTGEWPPWWTWDLELSAHVFRRMEDRAFTEVDLRRMLEHALGYRPDILAGRFIIETRHDQHPWEVIVEPDEVRQLLVVITAYPVD